MLLCLLLPAGSTYLAASRFPAGPPYYYSLFRLPEFLLLSGSVTYYTDPPLLAFVY